MIPNPIIVGIDPGLTGGIATLSKGDSLKLTLAKMPRHPDGISTTGLYQYLQAQRPDLIVLEHVGVHFASGRLAAFSFGEVFGMTRAIVDMIPCKRILVRPKAWQAGVGVPLGKDSPKDRAKIHFKRLFGEDAPRGDGLIDAALIAYYGLLIGKSV